MRSLKSCRLLPVAALCLLTAHAAVAAPGYRIELVGKGHGVAPKWASSISDNGSIVGGAVDDQTEAGIQFRSHRGKKVEGLVESQGVHYPGNPQINNAGVVVGRYMRDWEERGGMWASDGTLTDLAPVVGCDDSRGVYPQAINDKGSLAIQVDCQINGVRTQGGFLVRDGVAMLLPTFNGKPTYPKAMNKRDQVAGGTEGANGELRAFIWQDGKSMQYVGRAGEDTYSFAISDRGHVVGMVSANLHWHPFLYDGKAMRELPKCNEREVWPVGVNGDDWIVGNFYDLGVPREAALVRNGECTELKSMLDGSGAGWTVLEADDINNDGVIVGHGLFEGYRRVFIATPLSR